MERLTNEQENVLFRCLNIFYAKDGEIWVRGGGPYPEYQDVTLVQWIRSAAQKHGLNLTAEDPVNLGDEMYDALQDGDETVEGIVALLHAAAVQATEMRERLKMIEDILGDDYDLDHLRELMEADRDGRCVVLPAKPGSVVRCVNGEPEKQEIVDCITIYAGGRMTYGFHEFGVKETYVDQWSEDEAENYVPVENMG